MRLGDVVLLFDSESINFYPFKLFALIVVFFVEIVEYGMLIIYIPSMFCQFCVFVGCCMCDFG